MTTSPPNRPPRAGMNAQERQQLNEVEKKEWLDSLAYVFADAGDNRAAELLEELDRKIRNIIRWNAVVMVIKANKKSDGIGGHLSTYASAAELLEVGFNHFF